ncbi:hypothetical protein [Endozoicomonas sp. ALC020]|uniref:hypothetical protein n=1 Tax=unclassified Endozoicomonas TaxID=2644528 RepID=UPI003BB21D54
MANPSGAMGPSSVTGVNVQTTPTMPVKHQGTTAMYSLRRCCEYKDKLSKLTTDFEWPIAPLPLRHSSAKVEKHLEARSIEAVSSSQGSLTNPQKISGTTEAGIQAEREEIVECTSENYSRLCEHSQRLRKILAVALEIEMALDDDISFYQNALAGPHMEQQELQSKAVAVNEKPKMYEAKDMQALELEMKILNLMQQPVDSNKPMNRPQAVQEIKSPVDEKVMNLEKRLKLADSRIKDMQYELGKMQKEKDTLSKLIKWREGSIEAYIRRVEADHDIKEETRIEKEKQSRRADKLQKDLSAAYQQIDECNNTIFEIRKEKDAQSRQWDIDRAAMEREIETLRTSLRALSVNNPTAKTKASPYAR